MKKRFIVGITVTGAALAVGLAQGRSKVVFWNFDTSAPQRAFWSEQIKKFEAKNPDVQIEYVVNPANQYDNALELAIRGGNTPDVVDVRDQGSVFRYVNTGVFQPLDSFISKEWVSRFGEGEILPGLHKFGGKTYSFPYRDERINGMRVLVYYNKALFAKAGIEDFPKNWTEFRAAAKKITEVSKGEAYGALMSFLQSGTENTVAAFAAKAGAPNIGALGGFQLRGLNLQTGKYALSSRPFQQSIKFLGDLVRDGSMLPGFETTTNDQGVALFAQGRVGMLMGPGFWAAPAVQDAKPNFAWDLAVPPSIDGTARPLHVAPAAGRIFMSAKTSNARASWKWIDFMTSLDFAQDMVEAGFSFPNQPAAYKNAKVLPFTQKIIQLARREVVLAPAPEIRNPVALQVLSKIKAPQPVDLDIWRSGIAGRSDYLKAATTYDAYMNSELERAIGEVAATSPGITRANLFSFANWLTNKSFELQDY
jgi:multiple sugar transport system substrate-binding protein